MFVTHDNDIICLLETLLDSSISNEDERINIEGCSLLRAHFPCNKEDEVFVCITIITVIFSYNKKRIYLCNLKESLVAEIMTGKKKLFFSCLCRSPSQTPDDFMNFALT